MQKRVMLMFFFLDMAQFFLEEMERHTLNCLEQMANIVDACIDPYSDIRPEIEQRDLPPYKKDYSQKDPDTWTTQDICQRIWLQMCISLSEEQHREHFQTFGLFQYDIADGPEDPRWSELLDSLPGMRGYLRRIAMDD